MNYHGVLPAITTPFTADLSVDTEALAANARALLDAGCSGLVATGTMGEAGSLTREERRTVTEVAVAAIAGKGPVVVGVSADSPATMTAYAEDAAAAGADAVMATPPPAYAADERELVDHYRALAAAVELPIMAYNNPLASRLDMSPELIARLVDAVPSIVAIKESSGDARRISELFERTGGKLEVVAGGDDSALEGLLAGSTGWISGVAVVAPAECVELYRLALARELDPARELYHLMLPLARLDMTPKLVQYFKAGIDARGGTGGASRPPRRPLEPTEREILRDALARLDQKAALTA
ncbi:MAG: dihydrodipicolinate synthase family protein [Actinobacteria bacterium]|nr:dihydrodipicolinate synthase family protein [Actinomycetota bacterium]